MGWMPGCPRDDSPTFGDLIPVAVVLHRTYGGWGGDYSVGKNRGLFQFLVGQDDGQWVQFADTNRVCYHANGANFASFGIELTGTNDDPLTGWQSARLGDILRWGADVHGIPLVYQDPAATTPASIHVNDGTFSGVISHASVRTDDGTAQHTDMVSAAEFAKAVNQGDVLDMDEATLRRIVYEEAAKACDAVVKGNLSEGTGVGQVSWAETNKAILAGVQDDHNDLGLIKGKLGI